MRKRQLTEFWILMEGDHISMQLIPFQCLENRILPIYNQMLRPLHDKSSIYVYFSNGIKDTVPILVTSASKPFYK